MLLLVLDRLAANGLRFTQFYNGARCCPTRAALLTGVYAHQAGVGLMTGDRKLPGYRGGLGRNVLTIAEALQPFPETQPGSAAAPNTSGCLSAA